MDKNLERIKREEKLAGQLIDKIIEDRQHFYKKGLQNALEIMKTMGNEIIIEKNGEIGHLKWDLGTMNAVIRRLEKEASKRTKEWYVKYHPSVKCRCDECKRITELQGR